MWQLVLGLLQHLTVATAIVVERNMFAYYKVPLHMLDMDSVGHTNTNDTSTSLYFILQCPPKLNDTIPKPKDMQTCNVVDQYNEMWRERKLKSKRLHMVPFRIVVRPLPPPTPLQLSLSHRRSKRHHLARNGGNQLSKSDSFEGTPLKYLGLPHQKQKLLNLTADHRKFKRGSRTKGYQHMYHRDESYNDHIFYDELNLDGKFDNYGKENADP
ncbi:uncharacterized protein LOC115623914 [Scaptodrosophila lebanonensis]|uniref:Uncharacterized protein LOC115623914 n=1 Tax=Drosophila lebanonensis TaxID=7225 RepID=A0A6J2TFW8_DROLE|nr:uncharacterized protein LOC115623914 [Scaptodrosophila lebanonensis]